jgi:hypothetical protein
MDRMLLLLKGSTEQEVALDELLRQQQDATSSQYHRWLTPAEFGDRFGASPEDTAAIMDWLKSHGFSVSGATNGRRQIEFGGTARQVEQTFQTEIHNYDLRGESYTANATDIAIPTAIAPVVAGIVALHNFPVKTRPPVKAAANFTDGSHGVSPYDFATLYNVLPLWNSQGVDGTGQSIAVVAQSNINVGDISAFRTQFGLPANNPQVILTGADPGLVKGDQDEATLDSEWAGAVAKGAAIKVVASRSTNATPGIFLSASYVVNNNVAPVLTMSYGVCESASLASAQFWGSLWQQAAAQGISVFVSSGDTGSAGCDDPSVKAATRGFGVSSPASTPYNVAVGGTEFNEGGADSTYWNSTNGPNVTSVKSYIPEVVWNDPGSELSSFGGGVSIFWSTPSWQVGFGVPTSDPGAAGQHHRYLPDVSLAASAEHDGYVFKLGSNLYSAGGTSVSSPAFAGIMALINQATGQANGNPNPRLYSIAAQSPSVFHDVTAGNNAVPCAIGSVNCAAAGVMAGYNAGPGFDLATGWGSVDVSALVQAWSSAKLPPVPITISSPSPLPLSTIGTAYAQTLSASGGTPPYSWTVVSGNLPPGLTLSSAGVISGMPTAFGTYFVTVQIADSTGATTSFVLQLTVSFDGASTTASNYHIFPDFADGRLADGTSYRTTLMITNPSSVTGADCALQLPGLTVPGFSLSYSLPPGGWVIAPTSGTQNFQAGYATLQCSATVEAQLLYSFYSPAGVKISEATVFSSPAAPTVKILEDERDGARLGLAIANDTDQTVTYSVAISNVANTGTVTLGPRSSTAQFLSEIVPGIPANNVAQVLVTSGSAPVSVIGLRYSGAIFTTVPESIASYIGATASTYHVFPQFADGVFSDGSSYRTTRMYLNPSSTTASCTTLLRGLTTNSIGTFSATLPPGAAVVSSTSGVQAFEQGFATLQCTADVDAQAVYSYYAPGAVKLGEATVFSSPSAPSVQILADSREGAQVGLAIANDSDQVNTYTIAIYDVNGNLVGSANRTINARSAIAAFLKELVPSLPANHYGPVIVSSPTGNASIIGLRFTGTAFTTIPETIRQ